MSVGDVLDIAHILKRAYNLYNGCKVAPEEIRLASDHVHAMTLVLEGVRSDLIENHKSFIHQTTAQAKAKQHSLKKQLKLCEGALLRQDAILKTYLGFKKNGGVKAYDRWRWSLDGKKEIAESKSDLVYATNMLNIFMASNTLNALWRVESYMEALVQKLAALDLLQEELGGRTARTGTRPRSGSSVGVAIIFSLIISKFRKLLAKYRWRKNTARKSQAGPRRPMKPAIRVNSGLVPNKKRDALAKNYALQMAVPSKSRPSKARTPSPDFHYIPSKGSSPPSFQPGPVRRSSSMQRIMGRINARTVAPKPPPARYECWKVGTGKLAPGFKIAPKYILHKRGQLQLRKMAEVFKEAAQYDSRRKLDARSESVKKILAKKNEQEKGNSKGKKWYFVAGRLIKRDPGNTGMLTVEKSLVILVRK